MRGAAGYAHPRYAASLSEFGRPRFLPRSRGWVLERDIEGSPHRDAMWCYPLFACADWSALRHDLEELRSELVTLAVVTDPFGRYDRATLEHAFPDLVLPFKDHFVTDLERDPADFVSAHHRRYSRKALRELDVELCDEPVSLAEEWARLYSTLVTRHRITGIAALSRLALERQLTVPGLTVLRAVHDSSTVGMTLWFVDGAVAYYHLAAFSPVGYELGASYALFSSAIELFARRGLRWLSLGAGAGLACDRADGLTRFKRGWSTGTRRAYFCGRVFDGDAYAQLVARAAVEANGYFPAYRSGEFGRPAEAEAARSVTAE